MSHPHARLLARSLSLFVLAALPTARAAAQTATQTATEARRPMTFLDVREMARAGSWATSRDGKWALYTVSTPDWEADRSQSDIHLVSLTEGLPSHRRMTFTEEKNETSPAWSHDSSFFVFLSNRDASNGGGSQLYLMRPDGGEARRISDARDGVSRFAFSPDGRWIAFRAGKSDDAQLWRLPTDGLAAGGVEAEQLTKGAAGVEDFGWAPDSRRVYFVRPDTVSSTRAPATSSASPGTQRCRKADSPSRPTRSGSPSRRRRTRPGTA